MYNIGTLAAILKLRALRKSEVYTHAEHVAIEQATVIAYTDPTPVFLGTRGCGYCGLDSGFDGWTCRSCGGGALTAR